MSWMARLKEGFPVTFAGSALLALAAAAFWFQGVKRLDLVLLSGSVLIVILVAGLLVSTLLGAWLTAGRLVKGPGPLVLECGTWNATGFRAPLPPWLPFLVVRVAWEGSPGLRCAVDEEGIEQVLPARRGNLLQVSRTLRVGDILGLTEIGWRCTGSAPARILPLRATLDPGATLSGLIRGEDLSDPRGEPQGDRVDMRKYGHGDPMRMILWKAYARTRKAHVRIPERAVEPAPRVCAYLPASLWDEPAARLARTLLERGLLGAGWRFGADGAEDTHTLDEALAALATSGSATGPCALEAFLARARRDGYGACILLLPGKDGPWVTALQASLGAAPLRLHAVFAVEGWTPPEPPPWRRWALQPPPASGSTPGEVLDILHRTVTPAMECTLVDTASGDVLDHPEAFLRKRVGR